MALKIKSIPVLKGKLGKEFIKDAEYSIKKEKIDFSKQCDMARKILAKAKF